MSESRSTTFPSRLRVRFARRVGALCLVASVLVAGTWVVACHSEPVPVLRVGTNVWLGYEPLYLARSQSLFEPDEIRLIEYLSATEVINAYRNETIEAATLTLDEMTSLIAQDVDMTVILVMDISSGADVILGRPGIEGLDDLKGRRVGAESTALGAYVLTRALGLSGLDPTDVEVVHLEVSAHEQAFEEGRVDAVVTFDPVHTRLLDQGAVRLFDSSQIPGEIVDVLGVRPDYLKAHPERIHQLLESWLAATTYLREQPRIAAEQMAARLHISPEQLLKALDGLRIPEQSENIEMLGGRDTDFQKSSQTLVAIMLQQGLISERVDLAGALDAGPMAKVRR